MESPRKSKLEIIYKLTAETSPIQGYIKLRIGNDEFGDWNHINFLYPVKSGLKHLIEEKSITNIADSNLIWEKSQEENIIIVGMGEAFDRYFIRAIKTGTQIFLSIENYDFNNNVDPNMDTKRYIIELDDFVNAYKKFASVFNE